MSAEVIRIVGARQNNLKDLSLDLPLHELIVITGVSGSGKSSLAFDKAPSPGLCHTAIAVACNAARP